MHARARARAGVRVSGIYENIQRLYDSQTLYV
jgi:hypothetical protein